MPMTGSTRNTSELGCTTSLMSRPVNVDPSSRPVAGVRKLLAPMVAVMGKNGRPANANTTISMTGTAARPATSSVTWRHDARSAGHAAMTTIGVISTAVSRDDQPAPMSTPAAMSHARVCVLVRVRNAAQMARATNAGMTASGRSRVAMSTSMGATATMPAATTAWRRPVISRATRYAATMDTSETKKGHAMAE